MKDLKKDLITLGKSDFENMLLNKHKDIAKVTVVYSEEFDTGCKEGYSIKVVDNNIRILFLFECIAYITYNDGETSNHNFDCHEVFIPVGYKTPKGYFSKKKVDVNFDYQNGESLTIEQVFDLMRFTTDAKKNTFDPFYHQNQAKTKNEAAWNFIAANYITDPYCTK